MGADTDEKAVPFGYRQALMLSMVGMVVCLSLVVITGFVITQPLVSS